MSALCSIDSHFAIRSRVDLLFGLWADAVLCELDLLVEDCEETGTRTRAWKGKNKAEEAGILSDEKLGAKGVKGLSG